jgi:hypothetical protein
MRMNYTNSQAAKKEQKGKSAENPSNFTLGVLVQVMLEQPGLEYAGRVQKARSWKQSEPGTQDNAVGSDPSIRVCFVDAGWVV